MISLPLVRISKELYEKVKQISKQTGIPITKILDNMGKNMEFEFRVMIKEKDDEKKH